MAENIGRPDENTFGNQTFSVSQNQKPDTQQENNDSAWGNNQAKKIADQKSAQTSAREIENAALNNSNNSQDARIAENQTDQLDNESFYKKGGKKDKKAKLSQAKKYAPLGGILGF